MGKEIEELQAVLRIRIRIRIRIHRIHVFLGLPDPDLDPLVRGMDPDPALDPDPDPSIREEKPWFLIFCYSFFDFLFLKNDVNVASKSNKQKKLCSKISFLLTSWRSVDPDPPQNVMDPQHWLQGKEEILQFYCSQLSYEQCSGSMQFWDGSGSADPCLWLLDPDPAIFVIDLQDASKKLIFNTIFSAY